MATTPTSMSEQEMVDALAATGKYQVTHVTIRQDAPKSRVPDQASHVFPPTPAASSYRTDRSKGRGMFLRADPQVPPPTTLFPKAAPPASK